MAALSTALVAGGLGLYSANKQQKAAKDAAKQQAKGVQAAQKIQQENADRAVAGLGTGYQSARDAITGAYGNARGDVTSNYGDAFSQLASGFQGAESSLSPYAQQGEAAGNLQAALSGALGADAQKQAYAQFNDSPGQSWLRDRQEQAILRNAAALGGGLGNQSGVMQRLQENAAGLAQQDFSNAFSRLAGITDRGYNAARSISGLRASLGTAKSGLSQNLASMLSNMTLGQGQDISNLYTGESGAKANAYLGTGSEQAQLAQNLGTAKAGGYAYQAQNASPLAQGLSAFTGAGGLSAVGSALGGLFKGSAGSSAGDYSSSAFKNWAANQRA